MKVMSWMQYLVKESGCLLGVLVSMLLCNGAYALSQVCPSGLTQTKPNSIYTLHNDGTATDTETELMWQRCAIGMTYSSVDGQDSCSDDAANYSWYGALSVTQMANTGSGTYGYTNWRLPNIKELESLVEHGCYNPTINESVFYGVGTAGVFWSSTTYVERGALSYGRGYNIWFSIGYHLIDHKNNKRHLRLVRDAQ